MTLTQEAMRSHVNAKKAEGMTRDEIRDYFKKSLENGWLSVDLYTMAIEEVCLAYEHDTEEPGEEPEPEEDPDI